MILKKVKNEIGATAIEYGLIASLVAVVAVSGMSAVGVNLSNTYCTISKHLGGSGTCSGATSGSADGGGSTSGNGSGSTCSGSTCSGSTCTGSINNTNSIADGTILEQITKGLKDELNTGMVPKSLGGKDSVAYIPNSYKDIFNDNDGDDSVKGLMTNLSKINATDPITNVFGVYDTSNNNKPLTDYDQVNDALKKGGGNITYGYSFDKNSNNMMQFTTASGKVYTVSGNGSVNENTIPKK